MEERRVARKAERIEKLKEERKADEMVKNRNKEARKAIEEYEKK